MTEFVLRAFLEMADDTQRCKWTRQQRRVRHSVGQPSFYKWCDPVKGTIQMIGPIHIHAPAAVPICGAAGRRGRRERRCEIPFRVRHPQDEAYIHITDAVVVRAPPSGSSSR